jgi:outer membrane lipoprotein carrier protein
MHKLLVTLFCIAIYSISARADGLNSLENFLKTTTSGRSEFTQVVTSPARDGQTARSKTSSGNFEFSRPNRFKFVYKKPFEQSMVADGQTLWMHDVDLNQVTARRQAQVLASTPAAIIAAAADVRELEANFILKAAPDKDGLQWVTASPKATDGQLQSIRIGFRVSDKASELAVLEILDSFSQRSVLTFNKFETNPKLPADSFQFKPPAGADVIRQ